jgi:hypothetical protein
MFLVSVATTSRLSIRKEQLRDLVLCHCSRHGIRGCFPIGCLTFRIRLLIIGLVYCRCQGGKHFESRHSFKGRLMNDKLCQIRLVRYRCIIGND